MFTLSFQEVPKEIAEEFRYSAAPRATRCFDLTIEPSETVTQNVDITVNYQYLDKDDYPAKRGDYSYSLLTGEENYRYENLNPSNTLIHRHCWVITEAIEKYSATITKVEPAENKNDAFNKPSQYELSTVIERIEWTKTPSDYGLHEQTCANSTQLDRDRGIVVFENLNIVKNSVIRLETFHQMGGCSADNQIEIYLNNTSDEARTVHLTYTGYILGKPNITIGNTNWHPYWSITLDAGSKEVMRFGYGKPQGYPYSFDVELDFRVTR